MCSRVLWTWSGFFLGGEAQGHTQPVGVGCLINTTQLCGVLVLHLPALWGRAICSGLGAYKLDQVPEYPVFARPGLYEGWERGREDLRNSMRKIVTI